MRFQVLLLFFSFGTFFLTIDKVSKASAFKIPERGNYLGQLLGGDSCFTWKMC